MRLVVAGSGIVGSACAYVAAGLGAQVTLIDAARPGQATAAGAGIICPWTAGLDDPAAYAFACAAARAYPALVGELGGLGEMDLSYRRVGALVVADDDDQLEQVQGGARPPATPATPRWETSGSSPGPGHKSCSRRCARTCPRCTSRALPGWTGGRSGTP